MTEPCRWLLMSLLIIVTSTATACAEESFLEQFRIRPNPESVDVGDESGQASTLFPTSPDTANTGLLPAPELLEDPLLDETDLTGAASIEGFESTCAPDFDDCELPLIRYRDTCYQGTTAAYGVIPGDSSSGLGIRSLDLFGTFAVPLGSMDHLVSFTPFFRLDDLNAASALGLPNSLYEVGVKTFWKRVVNERLTTMVLFTPSVRSDFNSSQEAFKLFGSGMLWWKIVPDKVSIFGGAMYTGRQDYPVLPTMGIYWTPSPLWKDDIQFPSPRISRRIFKDADFSETWAYVSGVFGGNTWAVKRTSGQDDQLTLRDLRVMLGVEHLRQKNRGVFVETGWVFSRSMEFTNTPPQIDFGDAIILRAGIQF